MLFKSVFFLCVIGVSLALPLLPLLEKPKDKEVRILRNEREDHEDGSYRFYFETSDGQIREEESTIYEIEGEEPYMVVQGSYSYVGPDGVTYTVDYTADKDGFHPSGIHLPTNNSEQPTTEEPVGLPASAINSLLG